ncbi:hypothetical protein SMKI_07G1360 [Saccharomyces mikatae IFO 1815]|uniref:Uncharacterized protein n=1 Tax=Saccharomyces mikatae IFO 1815 TaxID=226126 RepID=A0AA35IY83_SACMI|nr:uncharacterized protein SMKI_07G1360 [Saccharomyces mikatae IFO 1815]CAI4039164.1 hypothetical protein SMKI_07G1360 [Saccharomyces mikatae IFO 1815]
MEQISIKDLESDQGKAYMVNTLKNLVCKSLLEFVDIQIECFMYPDEPQNFTRVFKGNKISSESSDKDSKAKSYPFSLGVGHSALFPLIYIRQKTNFLLSLDGSKRIPTELVNDFNVKFESIGEVYKSLISLYHSYLALNCKNINYQKFLGNLVSQNNFMLEILHRYVAIASSMAEGSGDVNTLVNSANKFIEDTALFFKRVMSNSNAYTEYHLMKQGINRNRSEETLVELEFRTLNVSDIRLDDEFDDFLQHRKSSLKIIHRRLI